MNYHSIKKLQKEHGFDSIQNLINTGEAWKLEGSVGREAMRLLESGACMLPKKPHRDYYGNRIPSRDELKPGTKGAFNNVPSFIVAERMGLSIEQIEFDKQALAFNLEVIKKALNKAKKDPVEVLGEHVVFLN
jgi:hypothetical protein